MTPAPWIPNGSRSSTRPASTVKGLLQDREARGRRLERSERAGQRLIVHTSGLAKPDRWLGQSPSRSSWTVAAPARTHLHDELEVDGVPEERLDLGSRTPPISLTIAPRFPIRIPFCDSVSTRTAARTVSPSSLHLHGQGVRDLVTREMQRLLTDHLGDALLQRQVGVLLAREKSAAPSGRAGDEVVAQLVDPVPHLRADRMQRVEVAERGGHLHLRRDVPVLEAVDLVQRDDDRDAQREDPPGDEPVTGADPVARGDDEQDDVDVLERAVDGLLHALGERVHRALEAGQVDEHELPVVAVRDAEDPSSSRVRDGRR